MNKIILYSQENGNLGVCIPTGELSVEQTRDKDCPNGIIVDASVFNTIDNDFYDAYELINSKPKVNILKAKKITKKRLRIERKELLEEQDILFQRNLENNIDNSIVISEKQRLRDITKLVDETNTLEELKKIKVSKE